MTKEFWSAPQKLVQFLGSRPQVLREYMTGFQEYMPHPGFMQMPQSDYEAYDELQDMPEFGRTADEFRSAAMEMTGHFHEHIPRYEDGLMTEELLQEVLESMREQNREPLPIQFDTNEIASHIFAAQGHDEEIAMDPALRENMIEIHMAVEQARAEHLAELNPQALDFGLPIPKDFFEQAEQTFEELYEMQPDEFDCGAQIEADFNDQEAMFEEPMEEMEPMQDLGSQTLENIIEAEQMLYEGGITNDMSGMLASMDEGIVEQKYETPEQTEPYPTPPGYDDGMRQQDMYDEQMLYMMNPYMMPGPFGPMPLEPGPGPGGGP